MAHNVAAAACQLGKVLYGLTETYKELIASKKKPSDFTTGRIALCTGTNAWKKFTMLKRISTDNKNCERSALKPLTAKNTPQNISRKLTE